MMCTRSLISRSTLALAAVGLAACATTQPPAQTAAGVLVPPSSVSIAALSPNDYALMQRMTDPNILEHLAVGDSLEIAMALVARQRAQNGAVLNFANRMIADHSMSLQNGESIATHQNLSMQIAPGDTSGMALFRMVDSLTSVSGTAFERTYIMSQIQLHQHMLAELQALRQVARNDAVRQHIDADIPVVQSHLISAEHIAQQLGYVNTGE